MANENYSQIKCEMIADFSIRMLKNPVYEAYLITLNHNDRQLNRHECMDKHQANLVFNLVRYTVRVTLRTVTPDGGIVF